MASQPLGGSPVEMDISGISSFLVLLEEKHYGRAAARLHITTPALTKRIQRLEREVGVALLRRDSAGVAGPTAAGLRFAAEASDALTHVQAAYLAARRHAPPGLVRLGVLGRMGDFPSRQHLRLLAHTFARHRPDARLLVHGLQFKSATAALLAGDVDVLWGGSLHGPHAIEIAGLVEIQRTALVRSDHELASAPFITAADLLGRRMLFDPSIPTEMMAPFYLGDLRPPEPADLVEVRVRNPEELLCHLTPWTVTTILQDLVSFDVPAGFRRIPIMELSPLQYYVAKRRADHRSAIEALFALVPQIAAQATRRNLVMSTDAAPAVRRTGILSPS